jgi:cap2 methyltransferase
MYTNSYEFLHTAHSYFNKKFSFNKKVDWILPENGVYCQTKSEKQNPKLNRMKLELNKVKSKLNDYPIEKWSCHTKSRNPCQGLVFVLRNEINAEFVTQAYLKFFEIVSSFKLISQDLGSKLVTLHLCEAPGAFITSLNHYLQLNHSELEVSLSI